MRARPGRDERAVDNSTASCKNRCSARALIGGERPHLPAVLFFFLLLQHYEQEHSSFNI
jgi:hypothetical protein